MQSCTLERNPKDLAEWTSVLSLQDLPIFSRTAQELYETLDDDVKGIADLAAIIMQDPNLTAKLLKMSNSPFYNHTHQSLSTVSRAIIFLGSNVIRELTVACSLFETVLSPENREQANQVIGDSILAAVQSREIALNLRMASPESIFVAALLNNIGSIAFWCFSGKHSQTMANLLKEGRLSQPEIEQKVLGFKLEALTANLCKTWKLGGLIDEAVTNPNSKSKEIQLVQLGKEVVQAMSFGWESKEMLKCIHKIETVTGHAPAVILTRLKHNTELAIKMAQQFGAKDASECIRETDTRSKKIAEQESSKVILADRKQFQFKILQELGFMMGGLFDINEFFEKVLEGIHYGIDMDRTLFCLLTPDKLSLNEKFSLGWQKDQLSSKLQFKLTKDPKNLFFEAINQPKGILATPVTHEALYSMHVINTIGKVECLLIPLYSDNKPIGLIYSDRSIAQQPFTEDEFNTAKHFSQQATIGLAIYRMNKKTHDNRSS